MAKATRAAAAIGLWLAILAHGSATGADSAGPAVGRQHTLVIGRVSDSPSKHYPGLTAVGHYLVDNLRDLGFTDARVVFAKDNAEMTRLLIQGDVDIVTETVYSALSFERDTDAEILLREWRKGTATYHTVFFTRKDSRIESLSDLAGRSIAFEDPGSTSGYFVPLFILRRAGLRPVAAGDTRSNPAPHDVRYEFANGAINGAAMVALGRIDAGVASDNDWNDPKSAPEQIKSRLRVFHETPPIIRSLLMLRAGVDPALKARLADVLVAMDRTTAGAAALEKFGAKKFDRLVGPALADLENARALFAPGS